MNKYMISVKIKLAEILSKIEDEMLVLVKYYCVECGRIWTGERGVHECSSCNSVRILMLGKSYNMYSSHGLNENKACLKKRKRNKRF